jgi:hypothetical protein
VDNKVLKIQTQATTSGRDESLLTRSATAAAIRSHFLWSKCHTRLRCRHCFAIGPSGNGLTNSRKHLSRHPAVSGKGQLLKCLSRSRGFQMKSRILSHHVRYGSTPYIKRLDKNPTNPNRNPTVVIGHFARSGLSAHFSPCQSSRMKAFKRC